MNAFIYQNHNTTHAKMIPLSKKKNLSGNQKSSFRINPK